MGDRFGRIGVFYDDLVRRHGDDPRSCDYGSAESQRRKFDVLADVADLSGKRILDVGCGLAHYADYLEQRFDSVDYVGIDLSPEMVASARRRRPDLDVRTGNVLDLAEDERFDLVSANGVFYLLGDDGEHVIEMLISKMWRLTGSALAFNSLSTWAPRREPSELQLDPVKTLALCSTLSRSVSLRHDYLPHDFTVYVYRRWGP